MDRAPVEFIRPDRSPAAATEVTLVGNELYVLERSSQQGQARILKMALDGSQEQLVYESEPGSILAGLSNLIVSGDTLFFIRTDSGENRHLYSLPVAGPPPPKLMYSFDEFKEPTGPLLGADDSYVYVSINGEVGMRIARADNSPSYFDFERSDVRAKLYEGLLWYVVDDGTDARPAGRYQIDPRAPTPSEIRVGGPLCGSSSEWIMSANNLYCAQQNGIIRFDRKETDQQNKAIIFRPGPQESGLGTFIEFGPQDDEYIYLSVPYALFSGARPFRRLNTRTNEVETVSCQRLDTQSLIASSTHLYWIERARDQSDTSKNGVYRMPKP